MAFNIPNWTYTECCIEMQELTHLNVNLANIEPIQNVVLKFFKSLYIVKQKIIEPIQNVVLKWDDLSVF